ncbi:MAG: glycosyltransferase family 4 protein [Candidatus Micrarchaeota archaeon]
MRVAMVGWEFPPFSVGGLATHCYNLTKHLSKLADITFFMPFTSRKIECDWLEIVGVSNSFFENRVKEFSSYWRPGGERGESEGSSFGGLDEIYGFDFFRAVSEYNHAVFLKAKELHRLKPFDLVHCHDWITIEAGILLKKELRIPLVFTVHSTEIDRSAGLSPSQWMLDKEKEGLYHADVVIAVSQRVKTELVSFGCDASKIVVVYNAVEFERFDQPYENGFRLKRKIVLYHGRLNIQKGPDFFLKAAKIVSKQMPEVLFVVSGAGDMFPQLVHEAIQLGIANKVLFLGRIPDEQLPLVYKLCDLYVLPSVSEPFGITALEAMASGKPVILSTTTGVGEVVKNVFRVPFWDSELMADRIMLLLKHDSLRTFMGRHLKEQARALSWGEVARQTRDAYLFAEERAHG